MNGLLLFAQFVNTGTRFLGNGIKFAFLGCRKVTDNFADVGMLVEFFIAMFSAMMLPVSNRGDKNGKKNEGYFFHGCFIFYSSVS